MINTYTHAHIHKHAYKHTWHIDTWIHTCMCIWDEDSLLSFNSVFLLMYLQMYHPGGCMRTCSSGSVPRQLGKRSYPQGPRNVGLFSRWVGWMEQNYWETIGFPMGVWSFRPRFCLWNILESINWWGRSKSFARTWHNVPLPSKRGRSVGQTDMAAPQHLRPLAAWGLGQSTESWLQPWRPACTATYTATVDWNMESTCHSRSRPEGSVLST